MLVAETGAYGRQLGRRFRLDTPALVTRSLRKADVAVSHLWCPAENLGLTEPFPHEDAFLVGLQISGVAEHELWFDDRPVPVHPFTPGATVFYDLRRNPIAYIESPFHSLMFYLPRKALDAIADEEGAKRVAELRYRDGAGEDDATVRNLGMTLLPCFANPEQASQLFVDHVTLALVAHVAQTYGGMTRNPGAVRGGLAPWQERCAKEIMQANLAGDIPLSTLAAECSLSKSHFSRAFRRSAGASPHQWLLRRRVEVAQSLLRDRSKPLSDVALASGFADQSHFTRVFTRLAGISPGAWRRALAE